MPLRLFEQLKPDGSIDDKAVRQLVEFVSEGQKLAEDKGATEIMAFATSAIRDASNGDDVMRRIKEAKQIEKFGLIFLFNSNSSVDHLNFQHSIFVFLQTLGDLQATMGIFWTQANQPYGCIYAPA
jgi:hypothetical protein